MSYQILSCQKKDHVLVINIIGQVSWREKIARLSEELLDLCAEIYQNEEIRVIVFTGSGENPFNMETDLFELPRVNIESWITFYSLTEPIAKLDRPIIVAINGNAIGLGLELTLACDIRIAAETSLFGFPHIKLGLIPWDGGTQRLPRLVGKSKAMEMILTGEEINAEEAYRIGLVNKVVPPKKLMTVVMDIAREMASKGPVALRYAKEAINKGMDLTLKQGLRLEADLYFLLHTTKGRAEGITAFRERRNPKFEGR